VNSLYFTLKRQSGGLTIIYNLNKSLIYVQKNAILHAQIRRSLMLIAIPIKMNKKDAAVAPLFGKAKWFALIKDAEITIEPNP